MGRAQGQRAHPGPNRGQPRLDNRVGQADGTAQLRAGQHADRRSAETFHQGRLRARRGRQVSPRARAVSRALPGHYHLCGGAVRRRGANRLAHHHAAGGQYQRRRALHPGDHRDRRLRSRAGRMVFEQPLGAARRHSRDRADDFVRDWAGARDHRDRDDLRDARLAGDVPCAGRSMVRLSAALGNLPAAGGVPDPADGRDGGVQAGAVRFARGRIRVGGGLLHRVLGRQAGGLHDDGLCRNRAGRGADHGVLFRRMASAVALSRRLSLSRRRPSLGCRSCWSRSSAWSPS